MRLITQREHALEIFKECAQKQIAVVAPCCERTAELEGILIGSQEYAEQHSIRCLPICIGFTASYEDNPQLRKVSTPCVISDGARTLSDGDVAQGFDIMAGHFETYSQLDGYFQNVDVIPYLDHGQPGDDDSILEDSTRLSKLAIVMYDCSMYEDEKNIEMVRDYINRHGHEVLVEAAADKIYTPAEAEALNLTREDTLSRPEKIERYIRETGVDFVVPNLGTEHRVIAGEDYVKKYESSRAKEITERVGRVQVLHGTSCLGEDITTIANDGIIKVNIYTAMAVGGGQAVYNELRKNEDRLLKENNLAINSDTFFADVRRRKVAQVIGFYLNALNYARL